MIMKINEKKNINEFNISLSILRMYLSFIVVNNHLCKKNEFKNIYLSKLLRNAISVPTFFLISFFLCHKLFSLNDRNRIKHRFERLLIPYFLWPIIIWSFNNIFHFYLKVNLKTSLYDLIVQFLTGHNIVAVLWFQLNLIIITLLMLLIHKLFNNNALFILINLQILAYYFQYSHINYTFFSKFSFYSKYPFGRFIEVIPFCVSGYIIGSLNIIKHLKKNRIKTFYITILILLFSMKFTIFLSIKGFMYQGIKLHITSIIIFILFALNPFEKAKYIKNIIISVTNYTSGVYYLHIPIWNYLSNYTIILLIIYNDIN